MQMFPGSDLKLRLTLRVIAASAFCFAAISAFFLVDGDRSVHARLDMIASITARTLELQQNKMQWINQPRSIFPDLQEIAGSVMTPGLCIAYRDQSGAMVQRVCGGPRGEAADAPYAFAIFHRKLFDPGRETVRPVFSRGSRVGDVVVSVDPATLASEAWQSAGRVMAALALALPLLGALVYMALARALRPTGLIRNGLERIATGDLAARLPPFDLAELSAIRDVFNHLAERLGTTLAERNELTRRLLALQDDERMHLARELHDEFGQSLAAIRALAASARQGAAQNCPAILPECDGVARTAAEMMERLRGALFRLRPPDVEQLGLTASLEGLIAGWNSRSRGQTRFEISLSGICDTLPAELAANLYRIAQEAITNAAKHAGASRISLAIAVRDPQGDSGGDIELIVEDDGQACDRPAGSGMGLLGMRERVAALGGKFSFATRQGGGSGLRAVIPIVGTMDRPDVGSMVTEHAA